MDIKREQLHTDEWLKDLPARQTGVTGFKPEEMIACPKCARANAPSRPNCLYCGENLPVVAVGLIKPNLRKLESWEKGFNVICQPNDSMFDEPQIIAVAALLKIEADDARKILDALKSLPVARAESEAEAAIVAERLAELGIESFVLSDEKLKPNTPARRLRAMDFRGDKVVFIFFNNNEIAEIGRADLRLIVSGGRDRRKIEIAEKYNRKKENKILESRETSIDEPLIDVYSREDFVGYRIETNGFDFSCLGDAKRMSAGENMKLLVEKLRAFSPESRFDGDYAKLRGTLGVVWRVEQKKDSKGVRKKGFGVYNLESVTTVDNSSQFTKYSRLQRNLV